MSEPDDPLVHVRRQWNDTWEGTVKLSQIGGLHWTDESGGINSTSPRAFLHGYVWCTDIVGSISHSCRHGPPPHRIKVCIVKKSNRQVWDRLLKATFDELERQRARHVGCR
jgi:hypothetical protein